MRMYGTSSTYFRRAMITARGLIRPSRKCMWGTSVKSLVGTSAAAAAHEEVHRLHPKQMLSKQSLPACFQCGKSNGNLSVFVYT